MLAQNKQAPYICASITATATKLNDMKIYNDFTDKYGNKYAFENFVDFAQFWFNLTRKTAMQYFPNFKQLQNCAANSKEARTRI